MPFRYLRTGRIFHLQIPAMADSPGSTQRREYFWLCGQCCTRLTVVVQNGVGMVQPRFLQLSSGERVEQAEEESSILA
jgi:hypothetical protein